MNAVKKISLIAALALSLYGLTGCGPSTYISTGVEYVNPPWGPPYYNGVRYYYLPDIECYYDLSAQEFIYLNNGQWLFSSTLPPVYGGFDLYNAYVVSLNVSVYQPWLHHQYYVAHYPQYYYRNVYRTTDITTIRGFNENQRRPIYWKQEDRDRINDLRKNEKPVQKTIEKPKPPQQPNYYGKHIGQPVKVKPQMRENKKDKDKKKRGGDHE